MDLKLTLIFAVTLFACQALPAQDFNNYVARSVSGESMSTSMETGQTSGTIFEGLEETVVAAMTDFKDLMNEPLSKISRIEILNAFYMALETLVEATGDCRDVIVADMAVSIETYSMIGRVSHWIKAVEADLGTIATPGLDLHGDDHPLATSIDRLETEIANILGAKPAMDIFKTLRDVKDQFKPRRTTLGDALEHVLGAIVQFSSRVIDDPSMCTVQPEIYKRIAVATRDFLDSVDIEGYHNKMEVKLSEYLGDEEVKPLLKLLKDVMKESERDVTTLLRAMSKGRDQTTTHVLFILNRMIIQGIDSAILQKSDILARFLNKREIKIVVQTMLHKNGVKVWEQILFNLVKELQPIFNQEELRDFMRSVLLSDLGYGRQTGGHREANGAGRGRGGKGRY